VAAVTAASAARRERRLHRTRAVRTPVFAEIRNPRLDEIAPGQVWEPGMVLFCIRKVGPDGMPGEHMAEMPIRLHPDTKDNRKIAEAILAQLDAYGEEARSIMRRMDIRIRDGRYNELPQAT
jgi:hypothetical protein